MDVVKDLGFHGVALQIGHLVWRIHSQLEFLVQLATNLPPTLICVPEAWHRAHIREVTVKTNPDIKVVESDGGSDDITFAKLAQTLKHHAHVGK